ncbi:MULTISPECIES: nucleoside recognition domain-containing protein [Clostridium]|uniref:Spore maturation protein A n=2 Tax=Clostridium TaxID=1485 RepID=A0A151AQF4_9CLOT|nr:MULTISPECIES: nucleoside recognition domain-containing protein [Clostridium]KYH29637.1 spore maturation protein A [Clostridium colicanis DSM 13634]MBE6043939.1 spore maturation protein [Clostridium thermopalmarium]PRR72088.1 Spore maturation protein A [Clostridium thermopalmarium DSM 5974]PVZ23740.1 spore maturation protein A [Clostridium thermopalmarium DSM 5974]
MINIIWFFLLGFGIIFGLVTGKGEVLSKSVISSTEASVKLVIGLAGMMSLWSGIMKIAQKSGITDKIAVVLRPILRLLFKDAPKNKDAMGSILLNLTSNMLGLSNAATPFGIKAMEELQKSNPKKDTATNDMALFLVLNATCIQLIPTSIISMRAACGSTNPGIVIIPAMITTGIAAIMGIIYCKVLERFF